MKIMIEFAGDVTLSDFEKFLIKLQSFVVQDDNRPLIKDIVVEN